MAGSFELTGELTTNTGADPMPRPTSQFDWGLSGIAKLGANISAVGVVIFLLLESSNTIKEMHREAIGEFRVQMEKQHAVSAAQREHDAEHRRATNQLIVRNQEAIERSLMIMSSIAKDVAGLAAEVQKIKSKGDS